MNECGQAGTEIAVERRAAQKKRAGPAGITESAGTFRRSGGALRDTPSASSNYIPFHGKGMSPDGFHRSARLNKAIPSKDRGLFLPWPVLSCSGKTLSAFSSFPYFRLLPYFRIRRPIAGGCPGPVWAVFLHASCGIPVCRECSRSVFHPEMGSPGLACMRA